MNQQPRNQMSNLIDKRKDYTLDEYRQQLEERKAKRRAKNKHKNVGLALEPAEMYKLQQDIASEYMRAPSGDKPTPRELAKKYPVNETTIRSWFIKRGFRTAKRSSMNK